MLANISHAAWRLCLTRIMEWPLLASLTDTERRHLVSTARRRHFDRGEVVFHEGDPGDSLHLVAEGRLAVRCLTPGGEAAMINLLVPGMFFGELALLRPQQTNHRTATVVALEPAETLSVSASAFHQLCDTHPGVEHFLVTVLARRIEELSERLLESLYVALDRRLYRRLAELSEVYGSAASSSVTIPLTQEQLSDLVGGTRPSVNQVLQRLAVQNIVSLGRGRIEVLDPGALTRRIG